MTYGSSLFPFQLILSYLCTAILAAPQNYFPQQYPSKGTSGQSVVPIVSETNEMNPDGSFSYR